MQYPHTIEIKEIPVPPKTIHVVITNDLGQYTTKTEFFASPEEFLEFWKPLVTHYEGINNDKHASTKSV